MQVADWFLFVKSPIRRRKTNFFFFPSPGDINKSLTQRKYVHTYKIASFCKSKLLSLYGSIILSSRDGF